MAAMLLREGKSAAVGYPARRLACCAGRRPPSATGCGPWPSPRCSHSRCSPLRAAGAPCAGARGMGRAGAAAAGHHNACGDRATRDGSARPSQADAPTSPGFVGADAANAVRTSPVAPSDPAGASASRRTTTACASGRCCWRHGSLGTSVAARQAARSRCSACTGSPASAEELADPAWRDAADALGARLGLAASGAPADQRRRRHADGRRRLAADDLSSGLRASGWSAERRDVVLAHEIAHLAGAIRCGTSSHGSPSPATGSIRWRGSRRDRRRSRASRRATRRCWRSAHGPRPTRACCSTSRDRCDLRSRRRRALPMVERSLLETRLMAILSDTHPAMARRAVLPVLGMALLTCIALRRCPPPVDAARRWRRARARARCRGCPRRGSGRPSTAGGPQPRRAAAAPRADAGAAAAAGRSVGGRTDREQHRLGRRPTA